MGSSDRIENGASANRHKYPWQVALVKPWGVHRDTPFCGGSILGEKTILTAAHCVARDYRDPSKGLQFSIEINVLVGEHDWSTNDDITVRHRVQKILWDGYTYSPLINRDWAIIQLRVSCSYEFSMFGMG